MQICRICGVEKPLTEFHKDKRTLLGVTSKCKPCAIVKSRQWYIENIDRHKAAAKAYREKHKEKLLQVAKEFAINNPEKVKAYKANWKKRNPEIVRKHARDGYYKNIESIKKRKKQYLLNNKDKTNAYIKKRRSNPSIRLNDSIGNQLRALLRGKKKGKKWIEIVGYTISDLMNRMQEQFKDGMSFDNYGEWHIDHIRPIASFDFSETPLETAKECWALSNLQPLWAIENIKKGAKWQLP